MAKKKKTNYKKTAKKAKNAAKHHPKAFFTVLIIIIVVGALAFGAYWFLVLRNKDKGTQTSSELSSSEPPSSEVVHHSSTPLESSEISSELSSAISSELLSSEISSSISEHSYSHEHSSESIVIEDMSINFLELGNYHTGDCTFIKAGDVDILIDAGSIKSSAKTIKEFVNQYCEDGKLEYVVATHAHEDHIAGFVGTKSYPGIFESYKIGTLIEFALTNSNSAIYNNYITKRTEAFTNGNLEHIYNAYECVEEINGAKKEYTITDGITMTILNHYYYNHSSSDENNYSVCTLFTQGDNHYLFTGDLEKDGEASLVASNTLPHCKLFKGGHHGSRTSNTEELLSVIQPEVVCICCCAGNDEYPAADENKFPTQTAINNIAKYTDKIYVTTVTTDGHTGYESMNGNITFYSKNGSSYVVTGSNNSTILKDTEWFKKNRTWPEGGV